MRPIKLIRLSFVSIRAFLRYFFFPEKQKYFLIISRYKPKFASKVFKLF